MEVEEETTANHPEDSMEQTTTVINQSTLTASNNTDIQSEIELTNLISESNKLDDSEPVVATAEVVVETVAEDTVVRCLNSQSVAALSGGADVPSDDVAAVVCGGSENVHDDVAEVECGVTSELIEKEDTAIDGKNDIEIGGVSVIEKNENDDDEVKKETVEGEEDSTVLKDGDGETLEYVEEIVGIGVKDESGDHIVENIDNDGGVNEMVEPEEEMAVLKDGDGENVEEMVGIDVKKDGEDVKVENVDNAGEENVESMVEERVVEEVVKEEGMVANEETFDKKENMVEAEEKSLDAAMEGDKSLDVEMEGEKSVDVDIEGENSVDVDMETEKEENFGDEEKVQEEEEEETESEPELQELSKKDTSGGKRKRGGKIVKAASKASITPRKTIEEDVCFICFDGGDLVLCDRR